MRSIGSVANTAFDPYRPSPGHDIEADDVLALLPRFAVPSARSAKTALPLGWVQKEIPVNAGIPGVLGSLRCQFTRATDRRLVSATEPTWPGDHAAWR